MLTQAEPTRSVLELLKELPPPWEASPEQIADVANRVGFPIVYQVGDDPGWHGILETGEEPEQLPGRQQNQLRRLLLLIGHLAPMSRGMTIRELWEAMQAECGCTDRTIRRDMHLLSGIGLIHVIERDGAEVYCWNDKSVRGAIYRHMARMQEMIW